MATLSIPLTQGKFALIDEEDLPLVEGHRWYAYRNRYRWYAGFNIKVDGNWRIKQMHRVIMDAPDGTTVDHISGDGLDNRRCNLRLASHAQNMQNRAPRHGGSSKFLGVSIRPSGRWRAQIRADYKTVSLGDFGSEEEAARAYDRAASEKYGEFAWLNFPPEAEAA